MNVVQPPAAYAYSNVAQWSRRGDQMSAAKAAATRKLAMTAAVNLDETPAGRIHLEALGYSGQDFHRSMSLWSNIALGFTYLSPLVGVYSLFAYSLSLGGPPAIWWIVIVGTGQFLVALSSAKSCPNTRSPGASIPGAEGSGPLCVDRVLGLHLGDHRHRHRRGRIRRGVRCGPFRYRRTPEVS